MSDLLLSLVTITRDDPAGLARTLASAASWRAEPAVEQVVVDGGEVPAAAGPAVRIIRQQSRGIAGAFNEGLAAARGEWVWFLNGGDQVDPHLAPGFLLSLLAVSRADMIIGSLTYEHEDAPRPHPAPNRRWPPVQPWIPHPAALVRRRLFGSLGAFDPAYHIAMDYEWWLRATSAGAAIDLVSVPLAVFQGGGVSQQPAAGARLAREKGDALRRHQGRLWRAWLGAGARLFRDWMRALVARRLGDRRPPPGPA